VLAQKANRLGINTILQLGDFGIWHDARSYLDTLEKIAKRAELTIYFIGGNHEDYDEIARWKFGPDRDGFVSMLPHVRWIPRGHRWTWTGIRFGALGGAFSVDWHYRTPGIDWWPGVEEVRHEDVERLGDAWLDELVTHDAPEGAQPALGHWDFMPGDEERARVSQRRLREAVNATHPKLVLHGHWHVRNQRTIEEPNG
jgi:hypothetical protein